jgi:hypothetical protein
VNEIFKLNSLFSIIVKVKAYRSQNGLAQCFNSQKCGYIWCTAGAHALVVVWRWQPPQKLGGKGESPIDTFLLQLHYVQESKNPHPANYTGCSNVGVRGGGEAIQLLEKVAEAQPDRRSSRAAHRSVSHSTASARLEM